MTVAPKNGSLRHAEDPPRRRGHSGPDRLTNGRDLGLEDLIREDLPSGLALTEKAMFGGWAWLLNGNLPLGARGDGLLARLGKGNDAWALRLPDVSPMISRGRAMEGWVRAGPTAYGDDAIRLRLIEGALGFVRGLPPKG